MNEKIDWNKVIHCLSAILMTALVTIPLTTYLMFETSKRHIVEMSTIKGCANETSQRK